MEIGLKIRELREKKGISVQDLADGIGVTRQQINHYESGRNKPPLDKIEAIASFLKINVNDLMTSKTFGRANPPNEKEYAYSELLEEYQKSKLEIYQLKEDKSKLLSRVIEFQEKVQHLNEVIKDLQEHIKLLEQENKKVG